MGNIRAAFPSDFDAMYAIEQIGQVFPWTRGVMQDALSKYPCWVIDEDPQQIQAFVFLSLGGGECEILNICVAPKARRRGYARLLLQHVLSYAKEQGAETAFLEVRVSNTEAQALYQGMGFNQVGIRPRYYDGREDALIFGLHL